MSSRKRASRKKRTHQTAHRRAAADPEIRILIDELKDQWGSIDRIERGERLRELSARGCSTRGLEEQLGQSATTVRRHITLANLPEKHRSAVKDGASAKKILETKALLDRQRRKKKRIDDDRKVGTLSDEIAGLMIEFCRGNWRLRTIPILKAEVPTFLNSVAIFLSSFEVAGKSALKAPKRLGNAALVKKARPGKAGDRFWMEYQAKWLANIVWAKATERPIWENAIEKTGRRARELDVKVKQTPLQLYRQRSREKQQRMVDLMAGPGRRKY